MGEEEEKHPMGMGLATDCDGVVKKWYEMYRKQRRKDGWM